MVGAAPPAGAVVPVAGAGAAAPAEGAGTDGPAAAAGVPAVASVELDAPADTAPGALGSAAPADVAAEASPFLCLPLCLAVAPLCVPVSAVADVVWAWVSAGMAMAPEVRRTAAARGMKVRMGYPFG